MKIQLRKFTGMRPVSAPDLLQPGEATVAIDTSFDGGALKPQNGLSGVVKSLTSVSEIKTIYKFGQNNTNEAQFWFQSSNVAHFVKGPVENDTEETTYFTGVLSYPAKTRASIATSAEPYPSAAFKMGLPKPSAPTVVLSGTPTDPNSTPETVAYVVTLVSTWGEESEPSAPSALVTWREGQTITVTTQTSAAGNYPLGAGAKKRIYRSATGTTGSARYLLVNTDDALAISTPDYADTKPTAQLGEALRSKNWTEPPDTMLGLTQMANGILAGYDGNTVCFSEPFTAHAWPVRYQQALDAPVVGMAAFDQSLLVATKRSLYVFTGVDPSQMTSQRLPTPQTCVSGRSMVEMNGGVVFATPDGLGYVGPSGFKLLSDGLFTRPQWQEYAPSSIHAYEHEGSYIAFYDTGTVRGGLVFQFGSEPTFYKTSLYATAGFRDRSRDTLFVCVNGSGTTREIRKWDDGSAMSLTWESSEFRLQSEANMAVARVDVTGTINFTLIGDGVTRHGPVAVSNRLAFKLPANYRAMRYKVRLTGTGTVRSVELADSMRSLVDEQ
jgi:hypothetical protein